MRFCEIVCMCVGSWRQPCCLFFFTSLINSRFWLCFVGYNVQMLKVCECDFNFHLFLRTYTYLPRLLEQGNISHSYLCQKLICQTLNIYIGQERAMHWEKMSLYFLLKSWISFVPCTSDDLVKSPGSSSLAEFIGHTNSCCFLIEKKRFPWALSSARRRECLKTGRECMREIEAKHIHWGSLLL